VTITVVALTARDLCWPWDREPFFTIPAPGKQFYTRSATVDPFPCYAHDLELVQRSARAVARTLPFAEPIVFATLTFESVKRTNGECDISYDYKNEKGKPDPWGGSITLWGKRIPPHPAMTRYLVAHEYGHAVAKALSFRRGERDSDALYREYRRLRGLRNIRPGSYGGATWHASTAEVFANDFRVLVAGAETEYWPHPGIERPERIAAVRRWWARSA
jgi:hypothetical protein